MKNRRKSSMRVDFHCHSTFSDGMLKPDALAGCLATSGVRAAALVDHDTTAGLSAFQEALASRRIGYTAGLEMTTIMKEREIHLLAYGIDPENQALQQAINAMRRRHEISFPVLYKDIKDWCQRLFWKFPHYTFTENGLVSVEDILSSAPQFYHPAPILEVLLRGEGVPANLLPRAITIDEAICLIHEAGGLAFLAHPLSVSQSFDELETMVQELTAVGLDGVEAFYSPYPHEKKQALVALAETFHLLLSGGSDFHGLEHCGNRTPAVDMPYQWWEKLKLALHLRLPRLQE